jgi:hypothetical protein
VLERLVQAQQRLLAHDVGVVRHQGRLVDAGDEMGQVHERPRKVVVHHVAFGGAAAQFAEGGERNAVRGNIQVERHPAHRVAFEFERAQILAARERQHFVAHAEAAGADAHLADHLLDAAHGVGKIIFVKMEDAHKSQFK